MTALPRLAHFSSAHFSLSPTPTLTHIPLLLELFTFSRVSESLLSPSLLFRPVQPTVFETLVAAGPSRRPSRAFLPHLPPPPPLHLKVDTILSPAIVPADGLVPSGYPLTAAILSRLGDVEDSINLLVNALRSVHSQLIRSSTNSVRCSFVQYSHSLVNISTIQSLPRCPPWLATSSATATAHPRPPSPLFALQRREHSTVTSCGLQQTCQPSLPHPSLHATFDQPPKSCTTSSPSKVARTIRTNWGSSGFKTLSNTRLCWKTWLLPHSIRISRTS